MKSTVATQMSQCASGYSVHVDFEAHSSIYRVFFLFFILILQYLRFFQVLLMYSSLQSLIDIDQTYLIRTFSCIADYLYQYYIIIDNTISANFFIHTFGILSKCLSLSLSF